MLEYHVRSLMSKSMLSCQMGVQSLPTCLMLQLGIPGGVCPREIVDASMSDGLPPLIT